MNSFSVRTDRIRINAPVDFVWEVLTENVDLLSSVLSPIVSLLFGGCMRRGFGDVGVALRLRAETLYRETKN